MAVVSMLKVSILILSLNVIVTLQAPLIRNQFTCLPRNGSNYKKSRWNSYAVPMVKIHSDIIIQQCSHTLDTLYH